MIRLARVTRNEGGELNHNHILRPTEHSSLRPRRRRNSGGSQGSAQLPSNGYEPYLTICSPPISNLRKDMKNMMGTISFVPGHTFAETVVQPETKHTAHSRSSSSILHKLSQGR